MMVMGSLHTSDADCLEATVCTWGGGCHLVSGQCEAMSDEDCAGSLSCAEYGDCSLTAYGQCHPDSDEDLLSAYETVQGA